MKIYASGNSNRLADYAGEDIWIRVRSSLKGNSNSRGEFIRVLSVDDRGRLEFNRVPGYFVDGESRMSSRVVGAVLNDIYHKYPEDFYIVRPLDTMSTDELMGKLEGFVR